MITKKREGSLLVLQFHSGTCSQTCISQLSGYFITPSEFHVANVFVDFDKRGQGIATALFKRLFLELKKNKVHIVTLDDCSDTGRLYTKLGFYYLDDGYPEMELRL